MMANMAKYRVHSKVRGEYCHAVLGRIVYDFDAGEVTPKNECEEFVLSRVLTEQGVAEPATTKRKQEG